MELNPDMIVRNIGGNCVIVPIGRSLSEQGVIYNLNGTSKVILEKLRAGADEAAVASALVEQYDIPSGVSPLEVVRGFVQELKRHGIVL